MIEKIQATAILIFILDWIFIYFTNDYFEDSFMVQLISLFLWYASFLIAVGLAFYRIWA